MKPKTRFQKALCEMKFPVINAQQKKEAIKVLFKKYAIVTKTKGTTCLECGHTFKSKPGESFGKCPNCKINLTYKEERTRKFIHYETFEIATVVNGMQILRYYEICQSLVYGQAASYSFTEVVRFIMNDKGKYEVFARLQSSPWSMKAFNENTDLELRNMNGNYMLLANTWSKSKLLPQIYRNGFHGEFHGLSSIGLFSTLLSSPKMEMLYKTNKMELFKYFYHERSKVDVYWPALKICFRNNYKLDDFRIWADYIDMLIYFKKDICNAYYVCPENLKKAHDKYMNRKKRILKAEALERQLQRRAEEEQKFLEMRQKYFDLSFTDGTITIEPLKSVAEFEQEGKLLSHCVYSSSYHMKPESFILHAFIERDCPIETIEINMKSFGVAQCRGKNNKNSKYHKDILKLMRASIPEIKKIHKRKTKSIVNVRN